MSKLAAVIAILAALAAADARAQALYSPPEGDFTVAFPQTPSVQSKPANRSKDIAVRRYVDQERGRALIVSIEDYPDGMLPMSADAGVYDHLLRSIAEDRGAMLVNTRAARLSGRPCLEGVLTQPGADSEFVRVLMVGTRVYELTYALPEGADPVGGDQAFFSSFKITKTP